MSRLAHLVLLSAIAIGAAGCGQPPPAQNAAIHVNLQSVVTRFEPRLRGVMVGTWHNPSATATIARELAGAGVAFLEFPGGLEADGYNWRAPDPGQIGPGQFAALSDAAGAGTRMCIVDYRADDPVKAAAWVAASLSNGWAVTYWEVGDEEYGSWSGNATPAQYASRFRRYYQAMKAADPNIKIGASIPYADQAWSQGVLSLIGDIVDWVALSYYPQDPGGESDAGLLAAPDGLPAIIALVRGWLAAASPARKIEIFITGWNSVSWGPGPQTLATVNGLFAADAIGAMAAAGVDAAGYFCAEMDVVDTGGTYGLFGAGANPGNPRPAYWGLMAWARAGGDLVASTSDRNAIRCWATAGPDRAVLILVNRDKTDVYTAAIALDGYVPGAGDTVIQRYDDRHPALAEIDRVDPSAQLQISLPPRSLTVIEMPK